MFFLREVGCDLFVAFCLSFLIFHGLVLGCWVGFWCLCFFVLLDFPFDLPLICGFGMIVFWCGVM